MTEPRGFTISDWMAAVVGISLCWTMPSGNPGFPHEAAVYIYVLRRLLVSIPAAVASAVISRQIIFRRDLKSAEWFVFLLVAEFCAALIPNVDTTLDWIHRATQGAPLADSWIEWRWGLACTVTVVAFGIFMLLKRIRLARCLRTSIILTLAVAMLWGPLAVFTSHFELPRSSPIRVPLSFADACFVETQTAVRRSPNFILFGVVALVAILADRDERNRWAWTCRASAALAALSLLGFGVAETWAAANEHGIDRIAAAVVRPVWIVVMLAGAMAIASFVRTRVTTSKCRDQENRGNLPRA